MAEGRPSHGARVVAVVVVVAGKRDDDGEE
jgi:hypothetical protein